MRTLTREPSCGIIKSEDPPQKTLRILINLYSVGKLEKALTVAKKIVDRFPNSAPLYNIIGAVYAGLRQFDAAVDSYKQAINITPVYADAYNNMGNALQLMGDLEAAVESYKQALTITPNDADAHNNLGNALQKQGNLDEAISSYYVALSLKNDFFEAYNNLGNSLQRLGNLGDAYKNYQKAISIKPDYYTGNLNLLEILTHYDPGLTQSPDPILLTNREIKKFKIDDQNSKIISDNYVSKLYTDSLKIIKHNGVYDGFDITQIYRRNHIELNCKRHMNIFNKYKIIPDFCFSCYKVQVEPTTVIELIKMFIVFERLNLKRNNTRKCMIELRPEISGFYKGLIYCDSIEEAEEISRCLDNYVQQGFGYKILSKIKRGCSEYPVKFPKYAEIEKNNDQMMKYNERWRPLEEKYDKKYPEDTKSDIRKSIYGLCLSDVIVMKNWLSYAEGIGDKSAKIISKESNFTKVIYDQAKVRSQTYKFTA